MAKVAPEPAAESQGGDYSRNLPVELQLRLQELKSAQTLGKFGFYPIASGEGTELPPLPEAVLADLELAFRVFAAGTSTIPATTACDALMYAGIFDHNLSGGETVTDSRLPVKELSKEQFLAIGHESFMARLSNRHLITLNREFDRFDWGKDDVMEAAELSAALKHLLSLDVQAEEVDFIVRAWTGAGAERQPIDVNIMIAVVSRYVRKHEHDWKILMAFREVMDIQSGGREATDARLTVQMLCSNRKLILSAEEAEEMLWSADWRFDGSGESLDFGSFMAAIFLECEKPSGRLPPLYVSTKNADNVVRPFGQVDSSNSPRTPPSPRPKVAFGLEPTRICNLLSNASVHSHSEAEDPLESLIDIPVYTSHVRKTVRSCRTVALDNDRDFSTFNFDAFKSVPVQLHLLLDEPMSSTRAMALGTFSAINILASVCTLVIEAMLDDPKQYDVLWKASEVYFTVLFSVELLLRYLVCDALRDQTKKDFLRNPRNICDFVAVTPWYIESAVGSASIGSFRLLRIIRLARLSRLARVGRLAHAFPTAAPIAVVLVVVWGIYLLKAPEK